MIAPAYSTTDSHDFGAEIFVRAFLKEVVARRSIRDLAFNRDSGDIPYSATFLHHSQVLRILSIRLRSLSLAVFSDDAEGMVDVTYGPP